jgi:hypothetical protein
MIANENPIKLEPENSASLKIVAESEGAMIRTKEKTMVECTLCDDACRATQRNLPGHRNT